MSAKDFNKPFLPIILPAILLPAMWGCGHFLALYYQAAGLEFTTTSILAYVATSSAVVFLLSSHCVLLQYIFHSTANLLQRYVFPACLYLGLAISFLVPTDGLQLFNNLHDSAFTKSQDPMLVVVLRYLLLTTLLPVIAMWLAFPFNGRTTWRRFSPNEAQAEALLNAQLKLRTSIFARLLIPIVVSLLILLVPGTYSQSLAVATDDFSEFVWRFLLLFGFVSLPLWLASRLSRPGMAAGLAIAFYLLIMAAIGLATLLELKLHLVAPFAVAVTVAPVTMIVVTCILTVTQQLPRRITGMTIRQAKEILADPEVPNARKRSAAETSGKTPVIISVVSLILGCLTIAGLQYINHQEFIFTRITKKSVSYELQAAIEEVRQFSLEHQSQWDSRPDLKLQSIYRHNQFNRKIHLPIELSMEPWWQDTEKVFRRKGFGITALSLPFAFTPPTKAVLQGTVLNVWDLDRVPEFEDLPIVSEIRFYDLEIDLNLAAAIVKLMKNINCNSVEFQRCIVRAEALELFNAPKNQFAYHNCNLPQLFSAQFNLGASLYQISSAADPDFLYQSVINGNQIFVDAQLLEELEDRPFIDSVNRGQWHHLQIGPVRIKDCDGPLPANLDWDFLSTDHQGNLLTLNQTEFPADKSWTIRSPEKLHTLVCRTEEWQRHFAAWQTNGFEPKQLQRLRLRCSSNSIPPDDSIDLKLLEFPKNLRLLDLSQISEFPDTLDWQEWLGDSEVQEIRIQYENLSFDLLRDLIDSRQASVTVICEDYNRYRAAQKLEFLPVELVLTSQLESLDGADQ